ncbi:MAG: DNA repair protein RadA [Syntrophomonadaceae bacterium]|nr:DNA repair protein RadA [Bacillota bacterium]
MKRKTVFLCRQCGYEAPKWLGRCPDCGAWNQMEEESASPPTRPAAGWYPPAQPLSALRASDETTRLLTGISELDRVLGGGLVPGSLVLLGGDPGIGKSTLVLQAAQGLGVAGKKVLYASGEESPAQLSLRARRLGVDAPGLYVLAETDLGALEEETSRLKPEVLVIDSIQTVKCPGLSSTAGSVSQLKESTDVLLRLAKRQGVSVLIIGHVTKEGLLAGPRLLEHMVDCVLYFEGERQQGGRLLRAVKNRFGATHEVGIFTMESGGLCSVPNPSEWLLAQRHEHAAGSVVTAALEGTRPLLLEVQALVTPCRYGNPRRMSTGLDLNRVSLILAVLERHAGIQILDCDVFVNVVGGVRLQEPAADLAIAVSLVSSFRNRPVDANTLFFGEVGLAGELRGIPFPEQRLYEGARLGFSRAVLPRHSLTALRERTGLETLGATTLQQALDLGG